MMQQTRNLYISWVPSLPWMSRVNEVNVRTQTSHYEFTTDLGPSQRIPIRTKAIFVLMGHMISFCSLYDYTSKPTQTRI